MEELNRKTIDRAVLVGLNADCFTKEETATETTLDELEALLNTAGGECAGKVLQNKHTPDPRSFIGEGKAEEVRQLVLETGANVRADGGHKKYYYGIENRACDVLATDIQELDDGMRFVVSGFGHRFELFVPVLGRHTVYNTLAAVTAALLLKVPPETIQAQISSFHNTGMRQKIYERDGFTIIEDCYNAGPESTEAALEILAGFRSRTNGRCIAVLGDMLELGNRSAAEHYRIGRIAATKADVLYTYGINAERMVSGAITGGMKQKLIEHFDTHEDLAHMLKMRARPGDVILFKGSRGMRMEKALALFFKEEEE